MGVNGLPMIANTAPEVSGFMGSPQPTLTLEERQGVGNRDADMYDPLLLDIITAAIASINSKMAQKAPFMAERVRTWMQGLSGSLQPADYFTHPLAFPMLLLPWWAEKACRPVPDIPFQSDLAYSTINGYYHIRMIDDAMDGDAEVDLGLLPALNFFHTQFQSAYQPHFPPGHPFWAVFADVWLHSGESVMQDASTSDIDRDRFVQFAAQKVCAAKIPIAAVCYHSNRPDMIPPWCQLVDLLGCWNQMIDDLFDWRKDMEHGAPTFFLSEAGRRKAPGESVAAWVVREGFAWGSETLHLWMAELQEMAQHLSSPGLFAYLGTRERLFVERETQVAAGFRSMDRLLMILQGA